MVYLSFVKNERLSAYGKTDVFNIIGIRGIEPLGRIKWHAPWRKYCFFPRAEILWDTNCLGEVVTFINKLMDERKQNDSNDNRDADKQNNESDNPTDKHDA